MDHNGWPGTDDVLPGPSTNSSQIASQPKRARSAPLCQGHAYRGSPSLTHDKAVNTAHRPAVEVGPSPLCLKTL